MTVVIRQTIGSKTKFGGKMKRRVFAILLGIVLGGVCFLENVQTIQAEGTTSTKKIEIDPATGQPVGVVPCNTCFTISRDTQVYRLPGTSHQSIGTLKKGQPVLAIGSKDEWYQVYFKGAIGYIPVNTTESYQIPTSIRSIRPELFQGEIKINILGDSITYGDRVDDKNRIYASLLGEKCHAVKVNNYGWNGSAIGGIHPDKFIDRYMLMDADANLILVFGGTNDYYGGGEDGTLLGAKGDVTPATFYGSLNLLMCGLKQMFPNSEIVFLTPLKRVGYLRKNNQGAYLNQYVSAIHEMAAFYGIPVIDLFGEPELDFSSKHKIYLVDGLHPNEKGHALVAAKLYRKLFLTEF